MNLPLKIFSNSLSGITFLKLGGGLLLSSVLVASVFTSSDIVVELGFSSSAF